jgi:hypothetical protein
MDRLEAFNTIASEAARGELAFPTSVEASLKLQRALNDPDCHIDAAARLVQAEPLLAARTVAIANSVAYNRSGNEVTSVKSAVQRVGFRTLGALVAAVIVRQLDSKIANPALRAKAEQLWQHSAHVAALAQVIARRVARIDPDTAMFAGIVHEVGGFYLLSRADEFPGLLDPDPDNWQPASEEIITREVMNKLGIPEPVASAIEGLRDGFLGVPPESLLDTLLLANHFAPVASPLAQPREETPQAESVVDLFIDDEMAKRLLEQAEKDVASMNAALLV